MSEHFTDIRQQQTEERWVSSTEGSKILGIKRPLFYYLVDQGQIRAEPGRSPRRGRYSYKDIVRVKQLREERKPRKPYTVRKKLAPVVFDWIRPSDIPAVLQLDYDVYQENYLAEAGRYESWRVKNPELSMAAFDASNRKVCLGYVGLLPLDESLILAILRGEVDEKDITADDIQTFERPGAYYMLANSAVIHPDRPDLLYKILYRITRVWIERYPDRFIRKIYAQAVSDQGERVVQNFFMMPRYDLAPNAFELDLARAPRARLLVEFKQKLERIAPLPPGLRREDIERSVSPTRRYHDGTTAPGVEVASSHVAAPRPAQPSPQKSTLPPGYVAYRHFAKNHGVPENTVKFAIEHGRLDAERGEWKVGGSSVRNAFNEEQQQAFVALYRAHQSFHQCGEPACVCHS